jgi:predicted metalloendopeptidase
MSKIGRHLISVVLAAVLFFAAPGLRSWQALAANIHAPDYAEATGPNSIVPQDINALQFAVNPSIENQELNPALNPGLKGDLEIKSETVAVSPEALRKEERTISPAVDKNSQQVPRGFARIQKRLGLVQKHLAPEIERLKNPSASAQSSFSLGRRIWNLVSGRQSAHKTDVSVSEPTFIPGIASPAAFPTLLPHQYRESASSAVGWGKLNIPSPQNTDAILADLRARPPAAVFFDYDMTLTDLNDKGMSLPVSDDILEGLMKLLRAGWPVGIVTSRSFDHQLANEVIPNTLWEPLIKKIPAPLRKNIFFVGGVGSELIAFQNGKPERYLDRDWTVSEKNKISKIVSEALVELRIPSEAVHINLNSRAQMSVWIHEKNDSLLASLAELLGRKLRNSGLLYTVFEGGKSVYFSKFDKGIGVSLIYTAMRERGFPVTEDNLLFLGDQFHLFQNGGMGGDARMALAFPKSRAISVGNNMSGTLPENVAWLEGIHARGTIRVINELLKLSPPRSSGAFQKKMSLFFGGAIVGVLRFIAAQTFGFIPRASPRPQDDFYRYVNGSWLDKFKMPADKAEFGVFDELVERSDSAVKEIIDDLSEVGRVLTDDERKIAGFYKSFMDVDGIEARGLSPLVADFKEIGDIQNKEALAGLFASALSRGVNSPISLKVDLDGKNTSSYAASLSQSGLGLPDRDYYFKDDQGSSDVRAKYLLYIGTLLKLSGEDRADEKAQTVFSLEKELAQRHWTGVDNRDPNKTYNKIAVRDLGALTAGFDWSSYLRVAGVQLDEPDLIVSQPTYFSGLSQVLADQSLENWKLYMKVRTLDAAAPHLPKAYADAAFAYYGRALKGQPEMLPRSKRGVRLANDVVGELIGKIYVRKYFPESALPRMKQMVENLRSAYREEILSLGWMSSETKARALEKLAKFLPKIGYPDRWKDYSDLRVDEADLMGNLRMAAAFMHRIMVAKLGRPVDRSEWSMNPQTVNAYYNPLMNEIVFPAAILQPPLFDPSVDDAANYGAIGAVIGHEMSHGFDDAGAQFDGDGNLKNWWTPADKAAFQSRAAKLADQYDTFEPLPGHHINGKLTLGENIGDLGGLTIAYHAYQLAMNGVTAPTIGGFTGVQRFFMSWALAWRSAIRDEALSVRLATDPHSPAPYRVNGVVRNMPEFYKAFGVKEGDKLFLSDQDRISIW